MNIVLSYDTTVAAAPAGFKTAMAAAAQYLGGLFANPITVTLTVSYGMFEGSPLPGAASEGGYSGIGMNYATLVSTLRSNARSAADRMAVANLPVSDPTGGGNFLISPAQQKAWGLLPANAAGVDGSVGIAVSSNYDFSTNGTVAPGKQGLFSLALHEMSHALGRMNGLQQSPNWYSPLDLYHYGSPGHLELQSGTPAYFSIDGGVTNLNAYAPTDPGDWAPSAGNDAFDASLPDGVYNALSQADLTVLDVMGMTLACFAVGTRITTDCGMAAVETLQPGDLVRTAGGEALPVAWVGHRRVDCRRHPRPWDVWPVRVHAHAFGQGRPARDLLLSPDHAVAGGGGLIPIRYLVNGATIVQEPCDAVEYWHVELPRHDLLLAEGLAAESYLDTGNRSAFGNSGPVVQLHPEFAHAVWRERGCGDLLLAGPRVTAERRRLIARARQRGHASTTDAALRVEADGQTLATCEIGPVRQVMVPKGTDELRLRSRIWTPAHLRPRGGDTRTLGVSLARLWLDGRPVGLDTAALRSGWHPPEGGLRWTDGDAAIAVSGVHVLAFQLAMSGRYWIRPEEAAAARRA